ncbi:hypothetical protein O0L34_g18361 [Tuta absoluta]|nr:hypothetical protein O0L34_g18361 [Tuta absoluta]
MGANNNLLLMQKKGCVTELDSAHSSNFSLFTRAAVGAGPTGTGLRALLGLCPKRQFHWPDSKQESILRSVLTGSGKGPGRCWLMGGKGMRGSCTGCGRCSGCGRRGSLTGPDSGNANTCDCGSGKLMDLR